MLQWGQVTHPTASFDAKLLRTKLPLMGIRVVLPAIQRVVVLEKLHPRLTGHSKLQMH